MSSDNVIFIRSQTRISFVYFLRFVVSVGIRRDQTHTHIQKKRVCAHIKLTDKCNWSNKFTNVTRKNCVCTVRKREKTWRSQWSEKKCMWWVEWNINKRVICKLLFLCFHSFNLFSLSVSLSLRFIMSANDFSIVADPLSRSLASHWNNWGGSFYRSFSC